MGKIYTIAISSAQGNTQAYTDNAGTSTTDIRNVGYYYDWSLLPDTRYKLTFNFISSSHTSTATSVCGLYSDFAQLNTRFALSQTSVANTRLNYSYLGSLRYSLIGASSYLFCDNSSNVELYLERRPQNNNFTVSLINNDANKTAYSSTTLPTSYILTISLEELDE